MKIDAETLRSLLLYDRETGVFRWKVYRGRTAKAGQEAGRVNPRGYREIEVIGRAYNAHRLAWLYVTGEWPKYEIDHIDGQRGNNAFDNLRDVPKNINKQNQRVARKDSTSGIIGVCSLRNSKTRPFSAQISVGGVIHYLGSFSTAGEAGEAYIKAKRILHPGCTI